jgi:hypothetical protein
MQNNLKTQQQQNQSQNQISFENQSSTNQPTYQQQQSPFSSIMSLNNLNNIMTSNNQNNNSQSINQIGSSQIPIQSIFSNTNHMNSSLTSSTTGITGLKSQRDSTGPINE